MSASSHQLGFIPVTGLIGQDDPNAVAPDDWDLYAIPRSEPAPNATARVELAHGLMLTLSLGEAQRETQAEPSAEHALVRIGYWRPDWDLDWKKGVVWYRTLQDPTTTQDLGTAYMIVDVSPLHRHTSLGTSDPAVFQRRLGKIAELLLIAADHNGETYWRIMVGDLETFGALGDLSKALIGGGVPGAFISPVVGATLAGAGLLLEIYNDSFLDGLDVNDYAALRDAASVYRQAVRARMFAEIKNAQPGKHAVQSVLAHANDYAFTYTIKGSLHAVAKQNEEHQKLLETGESAWHPLFADQRELHYRAQANVARERTAMLEARAAELRAEAARLDAEAALRSRQDVEADRTEPGGSAGRANPERRPEPTPQGNRPVR